MQPQDKDKLNLVSWVLPLIVLVSLVVFQFSEWWTIGIVADPVEIAKYPFGAEGPVAGHPAYKSAEAYADRSLRGWVSCSLIAGLFVAARLRRSKPLLWIGYVSTAMAFLISVFI